MKTTIKMKNNLKIKVLLSALIVLFAISNLSSDDWGPFSAFLSNTNVTNVTSSGALVKSTLTLLPADPTLSEHGFVWSTSPNPTVALPTKHQVVETTAPAQTPLEYQYSMTGLNAGQVYYVVAYCIDGSSNAYYGEPISFTTIPTLPEWGLIAFISLIAVVGGAFVWRRVG